MYLFHVFPVPNVTVSPGDWLTIYLQAALSHFLIKRDDKSNVLSAGLAQKIHTSDLLFQKKKKVPTVKVKESGCDVLFTNHRS